MSSTNRRSFLARSAALAAVPTAAALAGGTLAGQASAATLPDSAPVPPSGLPLTLGQVATYLRADTPRSA
jgi:hypothetical protein